MTIRQSPRLRQRLPLRRSADVAPGVALDALAREMCDRHTGIGADGLIVYEPTRRRRVDAAASTPTAAARRCRATASAASRRCSLRDDDAARHAPMPTDSQTEAGAKRLVADRARRHRGRRSARPWGCPPDLRQVHVSPRRARPLPLVVLNFGNPQCVVARPAARRGRASAGSAPALERHALFPERHQRRVRARRGARPRAHPDLGARRRADHRRPAPGRARRWSPPRRSAAPRATPTSSRPAARSASSGATTAST